MALLEFKMKDGIIGLLMFLIQEFIIKHPKNSAMTRWLTGEALSRPKLDRASNGCQVKDGESQKGGCRTVRSIVCASSGLTCKAPCGVVIVDLIEVYEVVRQVTGTEMYSL